MDDKAKQIPNEFKHQKMLKKSNQLTDEELSEVAGGFWSRGGYYIQCPFCGRSFGKFINSWIETSENIEMFECACGAVFDVDSFGNMWY